MHNNLKILKIFAIPIVRGTSTLYFTYLEIFMSVKKKKKGKKEKLNSKCPTYIA